MSDCIIIYTTTPTQALAEQIASDLIDRKLAACVQISQPISSHYTWQGQHYVDQEWRISIKTRAALFDAVSLCIVQLHPYDVPQIIATEIVKCSQEYREWLLSQTRHTTDHQ